MKKTMILIPALNPPDNLVDYIFDLKNNGLNDILVINDGSVKKFEKIFEKIANIDGVKIFSHAKNLGKGRALKNAFNYFLTLPNLDEFNGIVSCDSDGQHRVKDVLNIANNLEKYSNSLILGCRDFGNKNVPFKSKFGNKTTINIFKFLYRKKLTDTQTGLRGFTKDILFEMIDIFGERFEYETKMIITCFEKDINIIEIPIETVYYNNNSETHFDTIKDSIKIYKVIFNSFFKYLLSSLSSFFIDIGLFKIFIFIFSLLFVKSYFYIFYSGVISRIISSLFNFFINKNFVFNEAKSIKKTIYKYYSLCIFQMFVSSFTVALIWKLTNINEMIIKLIIDIILFLISYQVQRDWVFKKKKRMVIMNKNYICILNNKKNIISIFLSYFITLLLTLDKNLKIEKNTFFKIFINNDSLICLVLFVFLFLVIKNINFEKIIYFDKKENKIINVFSLIFAIINTVGIEAFRNNFNKYYIIIFFLIMLLYFIVFNFFIRILYDKIKNIEFYQNYFINKKFNVKLFIKILFPIFIVRIVFFLIFFPGNFTWDSMYSIKEGIGVLPLSNSHPYVYIYLVGIFGKFGLKYFSSVGIGIGIFNFINLIFTSIIFSFLLYKLFEFEFNKKLKIFLYIYFCLNPYFIIYSFTLYKDVVLGNFILIFIFIMIEIIYRPEKFFNKKSSIIYFVLAIFGIFILHRKAIIYIVVGLISLVLKMKKIYKIKIITLILLTIFFCLSVNGIMKIILNPLESSRKYDYLSTRFQQLASVVKYHPESFSKDELKLCDEIFGLERIKNDFDPYCADPIKNHIKNENFKNLKNKFIKLWFKMYLKHPKTNIDAFLNLSLSYFYPYNQREGIWIGDYYDNMYSSDTDWFTYKTFGLQSNLYLKEKYGYFDKGWEQNTDFKKVNKIKTIFKEIIYSLCSYPVISSFLKAGFSTWILILSIGYSILKKNKKIIPLLYFVLSILFTCIYSPVVNYYRYSYLLFITVPILIPLLFIREKTIE